MITQVSEIHTCGLVKQIDSRLHLVHILSPSLEITDYLRIIFNIKASLPLKLEPFSSLCHLD